MPAFKIQSKNLKKTQNQKLSEPKEIYTNK